MGGMGGPGGMGMGGHGSMGPNGMMGPNGPMMGGMGPNGPMGPMGPCGMKGIRGPCGGPDMKQGMCTDMHMGRGCVGPMGVSLLKYILSFVLDLFNLQCLMVAFSSSECQIPWAEWEGLNLV